MALSSVGKGVNPYALIVQMHHLENRGGGGQLLGDGDWKQFLKQQVLLKQQVI